MDRRLKIILTILIIILISIISFAGIYVQDTKFMKNILPEYQLGMDLKGYRAITIKVSDETQTIYYDKDGNEVESETEDGTSKEVPINSEDILNKENFKNTKDMIEQRFKELNISEYLIRLNEKDGTITIQIPEDDMTDLAVQFLYSQGKLTIEDEDGQVLLDNSNLEKVKVGYNNTSSLGTSVALSFKFNEDSIEKLKEITNTYIESEDEEGNDTTKKVSINIDGSPLLETSFEEEIANGELKLTLGTSMDSSTINSYIQQASNIAILLNNGPFPITYTMEQNRFIQSDLSLENARIPAIVTAIILGIALLFLIIKYRKLGLLSAISVIGYLAILLLAVRIFNLVITIEGILGILISAVLNYILIVYILHIISKKEKNKVEYKTAYNKSMLSMVLILIPTLIIGIALCFANWLPAYSFGTVIFWGLLIMAIYNVLVTRILFLNSVKE